MAVAWAEGVCAVPPLEREGRLEALLGPETPKICHDLKTCLHDLEALGLPQAGFRFDTALAAYDLNPSQGDYSLTKVAMAYLGRTPEGLEDRAAALWQLRECLEPKLQEQGMENLYREIELPLVRHPVPHGAGGSGCGPEYPGELRPNADGTDCRLRAGNLRATPVGSLTSTPPSSWERSCLSG